MRRQSTPGEWQAAHPSSSCAFVKVPSDAKDTHNQPVSGTAVASSGFHITVRLP
jgi:hypothetical protein